MKRVAGFVEQDTIEAAMVLGKARGKPLNWGATRGPSTDPRRPSGGSKAQG